MICPNCGRNTPKGKYCEHCGARTDGSEDTGMGKTAGALHSTGNRRVLVGIVLIIVICAIAAVIFLPQQTPGSKPPITTIPQTTTPQPSIIITTFDKIGSTTPVQGRVGGVNPAEYNVVVYIYVDGWYGPKPLWEKPLTPIFSDSTWSCNIVTTKTDALATKVVAYIVPVGVIPPKVDGQKELPSEMVQYQHTVAERE